VIKLGIKLVIKWKAIGPKIEQYIYGKKIIRVKGALMITKQIKFPIPYVSWIKWT